MSALSLSFVLMFWGGEGEPEVRLLGIATLSEVLVVDSHGWVPLLVCDSVLEPIVRMFVVVEKGYFVGGSFELEFPLAGSGAEGVLSYIV